MTYISNCQLVKLMPRGELIDVARRYSHIIHIHDLFYTQARFDKKWLKFVGKIADYFGLPTVAVERRLKILAKEDGFCPEMLFNDDIL